MHASVTREADAIGRALVETNERLAEIVAVQRDIAAAGLDLQAVMKLTVEHARRLTGADGAMVNLVDGDDMVVRAAGGTAESVLGDRRPISSTLLRFAIDTGRPLLVSDSTSDPRVNRELSARVGDRSIICVPFAVAGKVVGSLNVVSSSADRPLTEAHRQTMEIVGGMLAAGVSHAAEYESKRSEVEALGRFQTLFEGAPIGIARVAPDRHVVAANRALCEMLGRSEADLAASPFDGVTHPDDLGRERELFAELVGGQRRSYGLEKRYIHRDGDVIWAQVHVAAEHDADGVTAYGIVMIENITERKVAEEALRVQSELNKFQATHDELTGLANRALFNERALQAIAEAAVDDSGARLAVLMTDLDRFKDVNDTLGHHAGDVVLEQVATRLVSAVRASDTVARLGGDEFAVLLPGVVGRDGVETLVRRIRAALSSPVLVGEVPIIAGASIGVAMYPEDGADVDVLVQRADTAMYRAKSEGASHAFYDGRLDAASAARLTLAAVLRRALDSDAVSLRYGAKRRTATGEMCAAVARAHWEDPVTGRLSPVVLADRADHGDLARSLVLRAVDLALADCASWRAAGLDLPVEVRVSCAELSEPSMAREIERLLAERGVPADRLDLAVSGVSGDALERARRPIDELTALGSRIVVDGVGAGSTALDALPTVPAREMRLDAGLVSRIGRDGAALAIVRALAALGRDLGLEVSVGDVADPGSLTQLAEVGCTYAEGPAVGPAVTGDEVAALAATRSGHADDRPPPSAPAPSAGGTWRPPGWRRR
ncbi:MAG TPA: diguanylate cyclase [Acidimicrobiales bacterium]|nr:diguanylate cyclase [Acidimicrobiales bacterium]